MSLNNGNITDSSPGGGGGSGSAKWGLITGTITDQTDLVAYAIPYSGLNYEVVHNNTGNAAANGAQALASAALCAAKTPNLTALSATNRAVLYLWAGTYDLGVTGINLEFVDIIGIGSPGSVIITCSDPGGTIQINPAGGGYTIANITINNTGGGNSISKVGGIGSDTGMWNGLILNAPTSENTYTGQYMNITATVDYVLQGNIEGPVSNSTFQNYSCGYSLTGSVMISAPVFNCTGIQYCFGCAGGFGGITISAPITDCISSLGYSFGYCAGNGGVTISSIMTGCQVLANGFSFGSTTGISGSNILSGSFYNCTVVGVASFGSSSGQGNNTLSGSFYTCTVTGNQSFGYSSGGNSTLSGYLNNCSATDYSFGYSGNSVKTVVLSGILDKCTAGISSFGVVITTAANGTITGTVRGCSAGAGSYGATSSIGTIKGCSGIYTSATQSGIIDGCYFKNPSGSLFDVLPITAGATVKGATVIQLEATKDTITVPSTDTVKVYFCALNTNINAVNLAAYTNSIITPYNVVDVHLTN